MSDTMMLERVITPPPPIPSRCVKYSCGEDYWNKLTSDRSSNNKGLHGGSYTAEQCAERK